MDLDHDNTNVSASGPLYFFDESQTGRLASSIDWSKSSLGPAVLWPISLKCLLAMIFKNKHPMFLFWGPDLISFYNDAFLPSFGNGKHPKAMGQKAIECWPEIWDIIGPQIDEVLSEKKGIWKEDHLVPIYRNNKIEEVFWTYSYSPAFDDLGKVSGVIVTCTETTKRVNAEKALLESAEKLKSALGDVRTLMDSTSEGIIGISEKGLINYVNPATLRLFKYKTETEMVGKSSHELIHHSYADGSEYPIKECPIIQSLRTGNTAHIEDEVLWRSDGTSFNADYRSTPVVRDGRINGAVLTIVDHTERRNFLIDLKNSERWLSTTLRSLGNAVIATDQFNRIEFMNSDAENITGWKLYEVQNLPLNSVFKVIENETKKPILNPISKVYREKKMINLSSQMTLVNRDSTEISIENASAAPIFGKSGNVSGVVLAFRDVAEDTKIEREKSEYIRLLSSERSKLLKLFDQAPIPIAMVEGPDHRFVFANSCYTKLLCGGKKVEGMKLANGISDSMKQSADGLLNEVYLTGERKIGKEITSKIQNSDGTVETFYFDFLYEPFKNIQDEAEGILILVIDVSGQVNARKVMEASRELIENQQKWLEEVLNRLPIGLIMNEIKTGKFLFSNHYSDQMYGDSLLKANEAEDPSDAIEVYDLEGNRFGPKELLSNRAAIGGEEIDNQQVRWKTKNGEFIVNVSSITLPAMYGHEATVIMPFQNITEMKRIQSELEHAKQLAEIANHSKSAFLANMSHEIRTPMTAVLGFTEILKDPNLSSSERLDCVNRIDRSGRGLLKLLDDILDLSRIEAGHPPIEKTRFSPLLITHEVVSMLRPQVEAKDINIEVKLGSPVPDKILSDPSRLKQILVNLVGNAIKFTSTGRITITLRQEKMNENNKNLLAIEVEDTGIGISDADQIKLFHPFAQADESITRRFGGTGLGLALSRKLSEQLGGDLKILQSIPEKGSTFIVKIDTGELINIPFVNQVYTKIRPEMLITAPVTDLSLKDIRVLLAEDVIDNQIIMSRYLENAGAIVDVVDNGEMAVEEALHNDYDIVLMDIQMPVLDGLSATRRLRENNFEKPIVALTAHAMKEERDSSLEAGCNDHITKPVSRSQLVEQVKKLTENKLHNLH